MSQQSGPHHASGAAPQKAWGGVFQEPTDKRVEAFSESVSFDRRLADDDIDGSIAHSQMLAERGIISADDQARIVYGLNTILAFVNILFLGAGAKVWGYSGALLSGLVFAALIVPVFWFRHYLQDGGKFPKEAYDDLGLAYGELGKRKAGMLPNTASTEAVSVRKMLSRQVRVAAASRNIPLPVCCTSCTAWNRPARAMVRARVVRLCVSGISRLWPVQ